MSEENFYTNMPYLGGHGTEFAYRNFDNYDVIDAQSDITENSSFDSWSDSEFGDPADDQESMYHSRGARGPTYANFLNICRYTLHGQGNTPLFEHLLETPLKTSTLQGHQVKSSLFPKQVFMKESCEQHLDTEAKRIRDGAVLRIQKCARMFLARKRFLKMQKSIRCLQGAVRRYTAR